MSAACEPPFLAWLKALNFAASLILLRKLATQLMVRHPMMAAAA